jgi:uncharacterized membrane protein YkgB
MPFSAPQHHESVTHQWTFGLSSLLGCMNIQVGLGRLFKGIYLKTAVLGGCELALQAIALRPTLRVLYTTGNSITDKMKAFIEGTRFLVSRTQKISSRTPSKSCSQRKF